MAQVMNHEQTTAPRRDVPSMRDLPRAYRTSSSTKTMLRRYEPYRSSTPRLPTHLPSINIPRVPPAPRSSPSPHDYRTGPKNYDPLRPEGLYQASKGARRDIKWMQKHADKAPAPAMVPPRAAPPMPSRSQLLSQPRARVSVPTYRINVPRSHQAIDEARRSSYERVQGSMPRRISQDHMTLPVQTPTHSHQRRSYCGGALPRVVPSAGTIGGGAVIKEQMAVIASAREQWADEKQAQRKAEWDRKVKRIQLQVFVHARPTPCPWGSCPALLNSWALLEKHLHHAHLHPHSSEMPAPGKPIMCKIKKCDQIFGTGGECLQHCLSSHMGIYGARCPFNCAFEGESFDALMSHIGRRHREATPDDFVPGLIHHFPPNLPPVSALPKLPERQSPCPKPPAQRPSPSAGPSIHSVGSGGDPSPRIVALVRKKCFAQKKPIPDHYVKKQGALAAILAIIDNCQREQLMSRSIPLSDLRMPNHKEEEGEEELDPIDEEEGLYISHGMSSMVLNMVDVTAERKRAEKEARMHIKRLEAKGEIVSDRPKVNRFWTRSHTGSVKRGDIGQPDNRMKADFDRQYEARHRRRLMPSINKLSVEVSEDSDTTDDTASESASLSSVYEPRNYKSWSQATRARRTKTKLSK